jgi:hypothetical protein
MSAAALELKPKHACRACGRPFDPREGQQVCDECLARRTLFWVAAAVLCIVTTLLAAARWWHVPPQP